jgi:RNA 2',3'-cyclic 3'-phosphodiesterase
MRLFVSINLPQNITEYVFAVQRELAEQNLFAGTFPNADNLHITLKFLGDVDEKKIPEIQKALRIIKMPAFKICLKNKMGVFPSESTIRTIWIDLKSEELAALATQVNNILEQFTPKESREFASHLTIARVNNITQKGRLIDYLHLQEIKFLCFEAKEFALMSSYLTAVGPEHTHIETYHLS